MGDSRCVKRLFTVFLGWIVGGTLAFSQLLPTPIYQKATYFSLEDVRLLESPFLDLQQKGKEYLLWLNPDSLLHFYRIEAGLQSKSLCRLGIAGCLGSRAFARWLFRFLSFVGFYDVSSYGGQGTIEKTAICTE